MQQLKVEVTRVRHLIYGPRREENGLCSHANNKGADKPAHLHSLISSFNNPCTDPESFVRGGPALTMSFFLFFFS